MDDTLTEITKSATLLRSALNHKNFDNLTATTFSVFIYTKKWVPNIPHHILEETSANILSVLSAGLLEKESQTLAAMAFCSVKAYLYQEIRDALFDYLINLLRDDNYDKWKLHICSGVASLRTECFTDNVKEHVESRDTLLRVILQIVMSECNNLNATTHLAFDTLNKIVIIISKINMNGNFTLPPECLRSLIHIVLTNFENPFPGVRQKIFSILKTLLLYFYKDLVEGVLPDQTDMFSVERNEKDIEYRAFIELVLTHLPWTMKSKYFLLTIIAQSSAKNVLGECYGEEIVEGLVFSLSSPHLVSAGEDLYKATLFSELDDWINCYFIPISHIISNPDSSLVLENFLNYWLQRPCNLVPQIVDYLLRNVPSINLYAFISLLKMSKKGGFSSFDWETVHKQKLKVALENYSDKIRSQAFSLICTTNKTSVIPLKEEFEAVRQFLKQNINSDNAAFRQKLLSSFTDFIIRIRDSMLANHKSLLAEQDVSLTCCFSFLDWLHSFFIFNLKVRCNYQRKITTLELYSVILTYFGKPVEGTSYKRKSNKPHLNLKIIGEAFSWTYKFESQIYQQILLNCLFDEDCNIRDLSSKLLLKYFEKSDFLKTENFDNLFKKGLSLCSSQIFYEAESGALILNYLLTLADKSSPRFKYIDSDRMESFLDELICSAEEQFNNLQEDMLSAVSKGSFLYGTLQTIRVSGSGVLVMTSNHLNKLILLLEKIVTFFISVLSSKSDPDSESAPSFGEMGEAISAIVNKSSQGSQDEERDDLHLTPAQLLVLNCVWINLKECSMLCSKLVEDHQMEYENTERCIMLVVSILRKCRHKGAIEAAGLALSKIVNFLTRHTAHSTKLDIRLLNLPEKLMDDFLESIVDKTSSTVSRRSAGLAILIHKVIAADARHSKPLLPRCVTFLLTVANKSPSVQNSSVDLPQSQAMHFLRALVQDAGLKQHLLPYYQDICVVALSNLASSFWIIRNAALQLFGAFLPKLVGQKPQEEERKRSQYLMFEELLTQSKPLIITLLKDFSHATKSSSMIVHAKLMPILTLVTNLNVGLLRILSEDVSKLLVEFQENFVKLFKCSIVNVRKLSAKAHAQFLSIVEIIPTIFQRANEIISFLSGKESVIICNNALHGYLLNVTCLVRRYDEEKLGMKLLLAEERKLDEMLCPLAKAVLSSSQSYFVKSLAFEWERPSLIGCDITQMFKDIVAIPIGFSYFVEKQLTREISGMKGKELEDIIAFCLLKTHLYDVHLACLNVLKTLFNSECYLQRRTTDNFLNIFITLKDFTLNCCHEELTSLSVQIMLYAIENMYVSSTGLKMTLFCEEFFTYGLECLSSNKSSSLLLTFILPVLCGMLSSKKDVDLDLGQTVAGWIKSRCDPHFDQDTRIHAAKAMRLLVPVLKSNEIKVTSIGELMWEACVDFLQDEIPEVRYEASYFVTSYFDNFSGVTNTFISLEFMFEVGSITSLMLSECALECLWKRMLCDSTEKHVADGIKNPFDHEKKNIFSEDSVVSNLAYQSLLEFVKLPESNIKSKFRELCSDFTSGKLYSSSLSDYVKEIQNCIKTFS